MVFGTLINSTDIVAVCDELFLKSQIQKCFVEQSSYLHGKSMLVAGISFFVMSAIMMLITFIRIKKQSRVEK